VVGTKVGVGAAVPYSASVYDWQKASALELCPRSALRQLSPLHVLAAAKELSREMLARRKKVDRVMVNEAGKQRGKYFDAGLS
jgi:hypothetical protein